ncbi:MAG TPA: TetR/AcrR family transcriptional regulator [Solimonas sp.]|nr:TetR/AcrR family transcriptional regulator [Solimonas sp.]
MPRKPAHEQFDTLKAIEDCAFELFGRYGYEGVSIGDIAKAAKLSKGALYWHFQGKEALYLDCLKRLHGIFDSYIFDLIRAEPDPVKGIVLLFTGLSKLLQDPRIAQGIGGYWLIPETSETVHILKAQRAFESAAIEVLHCTLKRGQEQGAIDLGGDLDDMARAIISLVEACVLPLRHLSAEEVNRQLGVLARTLFRAYAKSPDLVKLVSRLG